MTMKIDIISIFPDYFTTPLSQSLIAKAQTKGLLDIQVWDIRDFSNDKHKVVDDVPYGGGAGMVMKIEPIYNCLSEVEKQRGKGYKILLTPKGRTFNQKLAKKFSAKKHLVFLCGRYEGIDERVKYFIDDEVSIGDYVLMGGEAAAIVMIEAITRLVKGVVGREDSVANDSFSDNLLEYPQYTRPYVFLDYKVPDVLLSGDHKKIKEWRYNEALKITKKRRFDLFSELKCDSAKKDNKRKKKDA